MTFKPADAKGILRSLFAAAIDAASPGRAVAANLPDPPRGRTVVIGAGKAAIQMAAAVETHWPGRLEGFVVAPHGYQSTLTRIETVHAGHPIPDSGSLKASERAMALASTLTKDDLLIALISGGGSALLFKPTLSVALGSKLFIVSALLKCGANIAELNCVRKHLSAVKGGKLAEAAGEARVHTLVMSDVPGDDAAIVASGPTVPDPTTKQDALSILQRYRLDIPVDVKAWLAAPGEKSAKFSGFSEIRVIVSPQASFGAAADRASKLGLNVLCLGDRIEGEAREVGKVHAGIALHVVRNDKPAAKPCVILSGGETSVTVRGKGRGGRNVEFLLSLAISLAGEKSVHALAGDTDGVDGMAPVAGALIDPTSLDRARAQGLDPIVHLENNDAHSFFEILGDQLITGPTQTNVNDFRAILIAN